MKRLLILLLCFFAYSTSLEAKGLRCHRNAHHCSVNGCDDATLPALTGDDSTDEDSEILRKVFHGTFCVFHPAVTLKHYQTHHFGNASGKKQSRSVLAAICVLRL